MGILLIEDDKKIGSFIKKGLLEENYAVSLVTNGEEGLFEAKNFDYDLIILDVMLPEKDGFTICRELRDFGVTIPVLFLSAKDRIENKVSGLNFGGDDYLTKPFSFEELLARIRALLRRKQKYKTKTLKIDDLELDPVSRKVFRDKAEIRLSAKEYALLEFFMRNQDHILSETKIIEHVWDMNYESLNNTVNVTLHNLRSKVDRGFDKKLIHTIRGMGYIMREEE